MMEKRKRSAVFVAPHGTVGKDLTFRHYTDKVVAAKCPGSKSDEAISLRLERVCFSDANAYTLEVMKNTGLRELYEKFLKEGETIYRKALLDYMSR